MNRTMITATNSLSQLQKQMDIIGNNIANLDTTGYKSRQASFTELLVQEFNNQPNSALEQGRLTPNKIRQGTGAKLGQVQINMSIGAMKTTGRQMDTALQKEGQYFRVLVQGENSSSVQYTRNGALFLTPVADDEVMLVNSDGHAVLDENNNPITVSGEANEFTVDEKGQLNVLMANGAKQSFNLGVIQINKPQFFEQKGNNLIGLANNININEADIFTELNGGLRDQIAVAQGTLEQSNVNMAKEMSELMNVQRSYQFQARSITMADQMMGLVNSIR